MTYYTAKEVAKRWKLKRFRTVYEYVRNRGLRSKKVGGRRLFTERALLDFEAKK